MSFHDTVAAVSTPRGKGGIAVIRISGAGTADVLARVFTPRGVSPAEHPRRACFGSIHTPTGEVLDEGIAVFFAAPASFTGEDVAELSCHGGALLTERVLGAVLAAGALPATAGEFTRRALLHGKMTLSGAEALGALLSAETEGQMALARGGMAGKLSAAIGEDYGRLSALLADIYAKIDFPEEDLITHSREEIIAELETILQHIQGLIATWRVGRVVSEGVKTVICGPVNAGKSSLYNALVGRDAAIVTDVAGTTRDMLCETVALGQVTLRLTDTAGLRETADAVEEIGVRRAREALSDAELVLAVFDGGTPAGEAERALLHELAEHRGSVIVVLNKSDMGLNFALSMPEKFPHVVSVSAKNGDIGALSALVEKLFLSGELDLSGDAIVANARQFAALSRAAEAISASLEALSLELPLDICSADAERAMQALGEVDGHAVSEDIIADIFSHFCVGK